MITNGRVGEVPGGGDGSARDGYLSLMSEQRVDSAATAATGADADPGEGLGLAQPGAHEGIGAGGGEGDPGDMRTQNDDRTNIAPDQTADGDTEGERAIRGITGA